MPKAPPQARISEVYGKLPLTFEVNEGQVDRSVRYLSRSQGATLFLTPAEAVLSLRRPEHETTVVRMRLVGANRAPRMAGEEPQATKSNYFIGSDPRQWQTAVAHYARVRVEGVYPGVDLLYRGNRRRLEYDLVIAPGADPGRIRLAFRGADAIAIGAQGELILHTASGDLVQPAPTVYQEAGERRQRVAGRYVLLAAPAVEGQGEGARHRVGFAVGRYDRARPLIIDPVLVYSTFLGGGANDVGNGIAADGAGNAYVTGFTQSSTFPGVSGSSIQPVYGGSDDVFVTKINALGTAVIYSTYLGGSADDYGTSIAVDGAGNAYVTGYTDSTTFPGVTAGSIQSANAGGHDAFVTKINAAGTAILYSTFLGDSGAEVGNGIAVDGAGNAYVTGYTDSTTFPGVTAGSIQPANAGGYDAFVTKINAAGTAIVYSSFLGGSSNDAGTGIVVDGAGNAYLTGSTTSMSFPGITSSSIQMHPGGDFDVFVTKINAAGTAIVYSTFLGGIGTEEPGGIAVDGSGNAYVTGLTNSTAFPGVSGGSIQPLYGGGIYDAYVTKINAAGTAIVYSTFLGGSGSDAGQGIAVDASGNAYVTGYTYSTSFPGVTAGSIQPVHGADGGVNDAFVTKINAAGTAIVYSTFLGGGGGDEARGIAVDGAGNVYVTGQTNSTAFPGVSGSSLQPANGGGADDAFVTKISFGSDFYTLTPCRAVDTRQATGTFGGPAIPASGAERTFPLALGGCGVPPSARAVAINATVVHTGASGFLEIFSGDLLMPPMTSVLNFGAGVTRANNAVVQVSTDGDGRVTVVNDSRAAVDVLLDLVGYFQ
jgi:hypothetical protein